MPKDVATVDCETTSLAEPHLPGGRRVWEVAIIRDSATGYPPRTVWLQIVDVDTDAAEDEALTIGGFADRFTRQPGPRRGVGAELAGQRVPLLGVLERDAAVLIQSLTRDAVIAGSNPGFDMASFADLLRRHGREPAWYHHPLDVPNAALGWLRGLHAADAAGPGEDRWCDWAEHTYPTSVLSEACGIPEPAERHSAWADAVWMRTWNRRLAGLDAPSVNLGTRPNGRSPSTLPV